MQRAEVPPTAELRPVHELIGQSCCQSNAKTKRTIRVSFHLSLHVVIMNRKLINDFS